MGRPKKYTPKALERAIEMYFKSISRERKLTERIKTDEKDEYGHVIYEEKPIINRNGEESTVCEYTEPPTVGGICEYLGIHRSTWAEWCRAEEHPEYEKICERTRDRLKGYLEAELLKRREVRGIIFDLQNNYGYTDKKEVEFGERASRAMEKSLSLEERKGILERIAAEFAGKEENGKSEQERKDENGE